MVFEVLGMNPQFLFGAAGVIGGATRGYIAFRQNQKRNKKIKFDIHRFADTVVESIATGLLFAVGLPVTYVALLVTALAAGGVDSFTNKFGIKIIPLLKKLAKNSKKK